MHYTSAQALRKLWEGNQIFLAARKNPGNISPEIRMETSVVGQHPYAVILTCSDSRVPPEHIFSAGIGDLFVVRTAGNVVGAFELGSIEYGVKHLDAPLVVVMGHTQCGAVAAALDGQGEGFIQDIVDEIKCGLCCATDLTEAIWNNIYHSKWAVSQSAIIQEAQDSGKLAVICALYDTASGMVEFTD